MSDTACEALADPLEVTPKQAAFVRFADHCATCRTCCAMDDDGANLNLPCAEQDWLHEEYRQVSRAAVRGGSR
ncbi:hypothetical protein [Streptomyces violarus]|uniref:hypothetical protein n=1 Tax=Streptomyces violarus TaxID=67380 RepID=UPI0021BF7BB9|nr:hypothetical protein [Streptomyces violarus]MCT9140052.1 hypothetical protein [Streptomyces violarus]